MRRRIPHTLTTTADRQGVLSRPCRVLRRELPDRSELLVGRVGVLRLREPIRVRESAHFAQDDRTYDRLTFVATHSPASRVPSGPPMSCVVFFWRMASSTVASILAASLENPK